MEGGPAPDDGDGDWFVRTGERLTAVTGIFFG